MTCGEPDGIKKAAHARLNRDRAAPSFLSPRYNPIAAVPSQLASGGKRRKDRSPLLQRRKDKAPKAGSPVPPQNSTDPTRSRSRTPTTLSSGSTVYTPPREHSRASPLAEDGQELDGPLASPLAEFQRQRSEGVPGNDGEAHVPKCANGESGSLLRDIVTDKLSSACA